MSVMIRVSYETETELNEVKRLLWPLRLHCETEPQKGRYKRAYFKPDKPFNPGRVGEPSLPENGD